VPDLSNVVALVWFFVFIFGIVGVQLLAEKKGVTFAPQ
jgi:hypothetical protein